MPLKRALGNIVGAFLDLIYPPICIFCNSYLVEGKNLVCERCWTDLPYLDTSYHVLEEIAKKVDTKIYLAQADAVWQFSDRVQAIIHHFKYNHRTYLAKKMAAFMTEKMKSLTNFGDVDLLIPVPLHKKRLKNRGYNQSHLLCQSISFFTTIPLDATSLIRIKNTKSQTKLNMEQRIENVAGAFQVINKKKVAGKKILLIDDVITTGSTINACAEQLAVNGAHKIYALGAVKVE